MPQKSDGQSLQWHRAKKPSGGRVLVEVDAHGASPSSASMAYYGTIHRNFKILLRQISISDRNLNDRLFRCGA